MMTIIWFASGFIASVIAILLWTHDEDMILSALVAILILGPLFGFLTAGIVFMHILIDRINWERTVIKKRGEST